jgi:hypothetical protein
MNVFFARFLGHKSSNIKNYWGKDNYVGQGALFFRSGGQKRGSWYITCRRGETKVTIVEGSRLTAATSLPYGRRPLFHCI